MTELSQGGQMKYDAQHDALDLRLDQLAFSPDPMVRGSARTALHQLLDQRNHLCKVIAQICIPEAEKHAKTKAGKRLVEQLKLHLREVEVAQ